MAADNAVTFSEAEVEQLKSDGEWDEELLAEADGEIEEGGAVDADAEGEESDADDGKGAVEIAELAKGKPEVAPAIAANVDELLGLVGEDAARQVRSGAVSLTDALKHHYHGAIRATRSEMDRMRLRHAEELKEHRALLAKVIDHARKLRGEVEGEEEAEPNPIDEVGKKVDALSGRLDEGEIRSETQATMAWAEADAQKVMAAHPEYSQAETWLADQLLSRSAAQLRLNNPLWSDEEVAAKATEVTEQFAADLMVKYRSENKSMALAVLEYAKRLGFNAQNPGGPAEVQPKPRALDRQRERMRRAKSPTGGRGGGGAKAPSVKWDSAQEAAENMTEDQLEEYLGDDPDGSKFRKLAKAAVAESG